jgi:hypothetical protein
LAFALSQIVEKFKLEFVTHDRLMINFAIMHCKAQHVNLQDLTSN